MISIIITTYKEIKTLPRAINCFLSQKYDDNIEILIIGPDNQTEKIVKDFQAKYSFIKYIKDKGTGKPSALNLGFKQAMGDILILTDGDVCVEKQGIKYLLMPFKDLKTGAVSGQPVSINSRQNILGYWSYFLTHAAHVVRLKKQFACSGYLYAIRNIIKKIPENVLSDDAVITQMIKSKGYFIDYAPQAKVFVKYPNNIKDWFKQKIRSAGGYTQKQSGGDRNIKQEITDGIKLLFTYPNNIKEFFWTILLYFARIYLWLAIFYQIKIKNKSFADIWKRVESTK